VFIFGAQVNETIFQMLYISGVSRCYYFISSHLNYHFQSKWQHGSWCIWSATCYNIDIV